MSDILPSPHAAPTPVGLYIHIPFCASLCSYCDFYRVESPGGVPEAFVDHLLAEAELYRQEPRVAADTIYFGGGTPSLLATESLARLIEGLRRIFAVAPDAEVTLEANPETVDPHRAESWLAAGVTRLSLGAQSFDGREVSILGRRCPPDRAKEAVRAAAACGFEDISVDLMGGVPGQGAATLAQSVREALALPITHLSFYLLDLHRGTELHRRVVAGEMELQGEDALADLYEGTRAALAGAGFEQYEISNFALPGRRCRHNLKYWRGGDYIGLGPSAHGRFRGWMTANPRSVEGWSGALERGAIPHESAEKISQRRREEDAIIFGLRLSEGVPMESLLLLVPGKHLTGRLERLTLGGHVEVEEGRVRLTPRGFLLSNEVIGYLLPDLAGTRGDGRGDREG